MEVDRNGASLCRTLLCPFEKRALLLLRTIRPSSTPNQSIVRPDRSIFSQATGNKPVRRYNNLGLLSQNTVETKDSLSGVTRNDNPCGKNSAAHGAKRNRKTTDGFSEMFHELPLKRCRKC